MYTAQQVTDTILTAVWRRLNRVVAATSRWHWRRRRWRASTTGGCLPHNGTLLHKPLRLFHGYSSAAGSRAGGNFGLAGGTWRRRRTVPGRGQRILRQRAGTSQRRVGRLWIFADSTNVTIHNRIVGNRVAFQLITTAHLSHFRWTDGSLYHLLATHSNLGINMPFITQQMPTGSHWPSSEVGQCRLKSWFEACLTYQLTMRHTNHQPHRKIPSLQH